MKTLEQKECIWDIPEDKRHCEFCTANCNKVPTISTTTAQELEIIGHKKSDCPEYYVRSHCFGCPKYELEQAAKEIACEVCKDLPQGEQRDSIVYYAISAAIKGVEWQKEQKPLKYLPKEKVYDIMSKLTNLSFSERFPINSEEYVKINEITADVRDLLDYPIKQKPEWSEEDEKDTAHIIRILDDCYAYGKHDLSKTDHENLVNKLKSLRPQSHWKPSEEQILALRTAVIDCPDDKELLSLYEDLKKL